MVRGREDREAGFTLIEILVAMVLMGIIMSSLAVFFIGAQKSTSALRSRESATALADQTMEQVHSINVLNLAVGRDKTSSDTQWAAATAGTVLVGVDTSQMTEVYDSAAAVGAGATAALRTVALTPTVNKLQYRINIVIGKCYIPAIGGDCTKTAVGAGAVALDRVLVAVNWTDRGSTCPNHICAYVIASLISVSGDPTFNVNQVVVDTIPPSTPSSDVCTAQSDTSAKVTWSASTDASGIARYDVYRSTNPDFSVGTPIKLTGTTGTSYTDTSADPGTTYYYFVLALDTVGNASGPQVPSGTVTNPQQPFVSQCTTPPDTTKPVLTGTLTAVSATTTVTLTWPAATDDYKVKQYVVFRGGTQVGTVPVGTTTFTDTGLSPWTYYTYTVQAMDWDPANNLSNNPLSATIQTKDTVAPTKVTGFTGAVDPTVKTTLNLDWANSTDDVATVGYTLCRSLSSAMTSPTCRSVTTSNWSDTGLASNTVYYYTVTASDAAGNTSAANTPVGVSTPDSIPPGAPGTVTAGTKTATTLALTWPAASDNIGVTGYTIYRNGAQVGTSTTASFTDTGLTSFTSYTYTVKANDAAGNMGPASSAASISTTAPAPPTLSSSAKTYTAVTLNWSASTDNSVVAGYAVYRGGTLLANVPGNATFTYTDSGLTAGTAYSYTVKAYDAASNYSAASNTLAVTTYASPTKVVSLAGTINGAKTTTLSWAASTDGIAITGYKVYGGTAGTTLLSTVAGLNYTYSGLNNSQTYLITVYAIDAAGLQSPVSATLTCKTDSTGKVTSCA